MAHDLDAPARLLWWPMTPQSMADWKTAQTYPTLRRAVTEAMTNAPKDQKPWILTDAGTLEGLEIAQIWEDIRRSTNG